MRQQNPGVRHTWSTEFGCYKSKRQGRPEKSNTWHWFAWTSDVVTRTTSKQTKNHQLQQQSHEALRENDVAICTGRTLIQLISAIFKNGLQQSNDHDIAYLSVTEEVIMSNETRFVCRSWYISFFPKWCISQLGSLCEILFFFFNYFFPTLDSISLINDI